MLWHDTLRAVLHITFFFSLQVQAYGVSINHSLQTLA